MVTTDLKTNLIQSVVDFNKWCNEYSEWKGSNKELKGIFYNKLVKNIKSCPESDGINYFTPNNIFVLEVENGVISKLQFGGSITYNSIQDFVNLLNFHVSTISLKDLKSNLPFEQQVNTLILEVNNYNLWKKK
jgi:hypothetical protein